MKQITIVLLLVTSALYSQVNKYENDVTSVENIINAYYEAVSGPAGQPRQWERDNFIHHPDAQIVIIKNDKDGAPLANFMTLEEYHERANSIVDKGFFEKEINRVVQRHGSTIHVWSTYEWMTSDPDPSKGRGVNSIQMYFDGKRYWITSWIFDGRHNAPDVPAEYLPSVK